MYKEYTMKQLVLPLDLEVWLQENDIAFALVVVNLRKVIANGIIGGAKKGSGHRKSVTGPLYLSKIFKTG